MYYNIDIIITLSLLLLHHVTGSKVIITCIFIEFELNVKVGYKWVWPEHTTQPIIFRLYQSDADSGL